MLFLLWGENMPGSHEFPLNQAKLEGIRGGALSPGTEGWHTLTSA